MNIALTVAVIILSAILAGVLRGSYEIYRERELAKRSLKESQKEVDFIIGSYDVTHELARRYQLICHILENQTPLSLEIGYNGKLLTTALELDFVLDSMIAIIDEQSKIEILKSLQKGME